MHAAHRQDIGEHEFGVEVDGNGGRPAAHVDEGDAQLLLIVDQTAKCRGIGRNHPADHIEVATTDTGVEIAQCSCRGGDDVEIDAEALAEHAARIAHATAAIDRIAHRDGMDDAMIIGH